MQVSLRRARLDQDWSSTISEPRANLADLERIDTVDFDPDPLLDDLRTELRAGSEPGPSGANTWPLPVEKVLTPRARGLLELGQGEERRFGPITVQHMEAVVHDVARPVTLVFSAGAGPDLSMATIAFDVTGKVVVDFECYPPSAASRWADALAAEGLLLPEATTSLGVAPSELGKKGRLFDLDGDGMISSADFAGVLPSVKEVIAEDLAAELDASGAHVVLIGEEHDLSAEAETEALAEKLVGAGESVVIAYELPREQFGGLLDALDGDLTPQEAKAWREAYLDAWRGLARGAGVTISDAELEAAAGTRADHLLKMSAMGVEVVAIDGEASNRDALMAERIVALVEESPDKVIIGLVGMRHANKLGQVDTGAAALGADALHPLGRRLSERFGPDQVLSVGLPAFGADLEQAPSGLDRVYAKGAW